MAHWYALHAKPHKERQVSSLLETEGHEVYLPSLSVRRRGQQRSVPFFSCYLFARLNGASELSSIKWTPGLRTIVSFGDQPAVVPDEVISQIRKRLDWLQETGPHALLKRGDRVTIRSGPFAHFEAVFEEGLSSGDRARILVDCLGRWTRCEVSIDSLRKVY
jgi:transcriptional antiterminator RfaH